MKENRMTMMNLRTALAMLAGVVGVASASCNDQGGSGAGTLAAADAVTTRASALAASLSGVYVVSLSGATPSCDDTAATSHAAALQACIDKASTAGGGLVLVQPGTYSTGIWPLTLKAGVTLRGQGHFAAKLAPASGAQIIGTVEDNTAVEGLAFDQSNVTSGAIRFASAGGAHSNIRIENNQFVAAGSVAGTYTVISTAAGANAFNHVTIRGNSFEGGGSSVAVLKPILLTITSGSGAMKYVRVQDNDVVVNAATDGPYVTLSGLSVEGRHLVVSGNTMRTSVGSVAIGVVIQGGADVQVTGNAIAALAATVSFAKGSSPVCSGTVTGNNLTSRVDIGTGCTALVAGNTDNRGAGANSGNLSLLVRAHRSGAFSFSAGTPATLPFNATDFDYGLHYSASTGTLSVPNVGVYRTRACARFSATGFTAGDTVDLSLGVGGSTVTLNRVIAGGASGFTACVDDLLKLAPADSLKVSVNAAGTGTRSVVGTGVYSSFFTVERISD